MALNSAPAAVSEAHHRIFVNHERLHEPMRRARARDVDPYRQHACGLALEVLHVQRWRLARLPSIRLRLRLSPRQLLAAQSRDPLIVIDRSEASMSMNGASAATVTVSVTAETSNVKSTCRGR